MLKLNCLAPHPFLLLLLLGVLLSGSVYVYAADVEGKAPVVELTHWWVAPGELDALSVLEQGIQRRGGEFQASALENFNAHRATIIEQVSLGYFPAITHWLGGSELLALKKQGILTALPKVLNGVLTREVLFPEVLSEITVDDELVALPVGIHLWNTVYYNVHIYQKLKLTPPMTWDVFFEQAQIISEAGYTPIAVGKEPWQLGFILDAILISKGGKVGFESIFNEHNDISDSRALLIEAFDQFYSLRQFTSEAQSDNKWHENTNVVGAGAAAMQFMGDFALGELVASGKLADRDFLCRLSPGTSRYLYYGVDVFAMLKVNAPELIAGQTLLASTVLDPAVQAEYIRKKGGVPVRNDMDISRLDACASRMYSAWLNGVEKAHIPLPAGGSRLRMTAVQNSAGKLWDTENAERVDIEAIVDKLISNIHALYR